MKKKYNPNIKWWLETNGIKLMTKPKKPNEFDLRYNGGLQIYKNGKWELLKY